MRVCVIGNNNGVNVVRKWGSKKKRVRYIFFFVFFNFFLNYFAVFVCLCVNGAAR